VIKRIRFATRRPGLASEAFPMAWRHHLAPAMAAPPDVRPARVAAGGALPDFAGTPRHDGIGLEWFTDEDHLGRFEAWLDTAAGRATMPRLDAVVDRARSPLVVADEHVLRGGEWLDQRWRDGGTRLKHLALAVRAPHLTAEQFVQQWSAHAGTVGGGGARATVVIPDDVRGRAYVQNRPRPRASGDWVYDALNEVYVEGREGLSRRMQWFDENVDDGAVAHLVSERWFLAVEEMPLCAG
jgi:hypothetical protein